ncbi:MAG: DUF5060 domain-containing protein [Sedimentisphaerales bacterium]|nr:DUF5060 domain-containing protein [Sedimentisphaerales bacterium]
MWKLLPAIQIVLIIIYATAVCAGQGSDTIRLKAPNNEVGRYEKLELLIEVDRKYDNPFDLQEVELVVELNTPVGGKLTLPAFYCRDYKRRKLDQGRSRSDWFYPVSNGTWKARFAPMQVGTYVATARLTDKTGTIQSRSVQFGCLSSLNKGFLRISEKDPRFMEFSEGEPFFSIGQNLAFIGEGQYVTLLKAEETFEKLAANGANFIRIWTCCQDWAMAIEAQKSAWDRSWSRGRLAVPLPGSENEPNPRKCVKIESKSITVSPTHPVALRPNTHYILAGRFMTDGATGLRINLGRNNWQIPFDSAGGKWQQFKQEFTTAENDFWLGQFTIGPVGSGTVWLDDLSLKETPEGPELLWEADVNRPVLGVYNQLDCFMLDELVESAQSNGIYLMLCVLTRDLYMKHLSDDGSEEYETAVQYAKQFMRYAVARWGYSTSVAAWEYFNEIDPGLPTDRFYTEVGDYLEQIDIYHHLLTTSTWHPSAKDCRHPSLDIAQVHRYMRPGTDEEYKDEVAVALDRAQFLRKHAPNKPALIGEFGLADTKWGRSDYMKQDTEGVHFHTSLWASAFAGVSGTAMFWWWELLDQQDAYKHYKPLSAFLADVCFAGLRQTDADISNEQLRILGYQGDDCAYIWVSDSRATWWNQIAENKQPELVPDASIEIRGLRDRQYRIEWWDTYESKTIGTEQISCTDGRIQIPLPSFSRDIACKIRQ